MQVLTDTVFLGFATRLGCNAASGNPGRTFASPVKEKLKEN